MQVWIFQKVLFWGICLKGKNCDKETWENLEVSSADGWGNLTLKGQHFSPFQSVKKHCNVNMVCSGHSRPRACTLEKHQFGNGGSPVFNQFNTSFKSKFVVIFPIASIWWRNMTLHDQEMRVVWIYGCITLKEIFMLRPIRRQIRRSRRCTERNPLRGVPNNRPGVVTYSISSVHLKKTTFFAQR